MRRGDSWERAIRTVASYHRIASVDSEGPARVAEGTLSGSRFVLRTRTESTGPSALHRTEIRVLGAVPSSLTLRVRGLDAEPPLRDAVSIGVASFDQRYHVRCASVSEVVSVLGPAARQALIAHPDIGVSEGALTWSTTHTRHRSAPLIAALDELKTVLAAFRKRSGATAERLAAGAIEDTNPRFRRRALELLAGLDSASTLLTTTATAMLDDASPSVRVAAADHVSSRLAARVLTATLVEPSLTETDCARALNMLAALRSSETPVADVLADVVTPDVAPGALARAAYAVAEQHNVSIALPTLLAHLTCRDEHIQRLATGHALGADEPSLVPQLITALKSDETVCKVATLNALAVLASTRELKVIGRYARGLLVADPVKRAAAAAQVAIEERLRGAEVGLLTIASSTGQLTLPAGPPPDESDAC